MQWTLSVLTTLYLKYLTVSNRNLSQMWHSTYFLSFLRHLSISNISLSQTNILLPAGPPMKAEPGGPWLPLFLKSYFARDVFLQIHFCAVLQSIQTFFAPALPESRRVACPGRFFSLYLELFHLRAVLYYQIELTQNYHFHKNVRSSSLLRGEWSIKQHLRSFEFQENLFRQGWKPRTIFYKA